MKSFFLLIYILNFLEDNSIKRFREYISLIIIKIRNFLTFNSNFNCPCCGNNIDCFITDLRWPTIKVCPVCSSHDRHRFLWLFLKKHTILLKTRFNFFKEKKILLHFAPYPIIRSKLERNLNIRYITADLFMPDVLIKVDISNIQFKTNSVDIIICKHVLEHVKEDLKALKELYRILKPGGWALIQVPIDKTLLKTYENSTITTPEERKKHFGQEDHLRKYGLDFKDRIIKAGFRIQIYQCINEFNLDQIKMYGLDRDENIYYCTK